MTPDSATITEQITAIEAEVHKRGWDKPPELHLLYSGANGPASHPAVTTWPPGQYGDVLESLAFDLEQETVVGRVLRTRLRRVPKCYAVAFVNEAYVNLGVGLSTEEMRQMATSGNAGLPLADRPGSEEARTVGAIDLNGTSYLLMRVRGKPPMPVQVSTVKGHVSTTGRMPESLARILTVITGKTVGAPQLPDWLRGPS